MGLVEEFDDDNYGNVVMGFLGNERLRDEKRRQRIFRIPSDFTDLPESADEQQLRQLQQRALEKIMATLEGHSFFSKPNAALGGASEESKVMSACREHLIEAYLSAFEAARKKAREP